jgi:type IV secretion system protein VirD4
LVDPEGALERRNHWEKTSHSLLVGAILHILYAEEEKTLARVATFLSDPQRPFVATLKRMMTTNHLGTPDAPRSIPVVASAAREVLNKSRMSARACCRPRCRSSVSTAIRPSPRSPSRCDWRIADLVEGAQPVSLYLVIPPSDISRTKPLVRLILNQIGRRLTERLDGAGPTGRKHKAADDAGRVPGARSPRLLRDQPRLHGRLRRARLPDRPIAQPDREGLRRAQRHPR